MAYNVYLELTRVTDNKAFKGSVHKGIEYSALKRYVLRQLLGQAAMNKHITDSFEKQLFRKFKNKGKVPIRIWGYNASKLINYCLSQYEHSIIRVKFFWHTI